MTIRKSKRLATYKALLKEFLADPNYELLRGYCHALDIIADKYPHRRIDTDIWNYPELMKHRPLGKLARMSYWWPVDTMEGYNTRVNILISIINELSKK